MTAEQRFERDLDICDSIWRKEEWGERHDLVNYPRSVTMRVDLVTQRVYMDKWPPDAPA